MYQKKDKKNPLYILASANAFPTKDFPQFRQQTFGDDNDAVLIYDNEH